LENLIAINLFGQAYKFKTESEIESAQRSADLFIKEVERIQKPGTGYLPDITKFTILISAALNLAQQVHDLKKKHAEFVNDLDERSVRLLNTIDDCLKTKA
jgi:hypothetical protein